MPDIKDGETAEVKGSARDPYVLKNTGGVYSCSCPAWRNQSVAIETRTCKHLRQYLGEEFEKARLGAEIPARASSPRTKSGSNKSNNDPGEESVEDTSPGILLAHSWDGALDLTGWWMSEKLDGVRAYWDGEKFISRQGNVYHAPDWFIEALPKDIHLDGELWLNRKGFQRAVSIVRRQDKNNDWKEIKFIVFDAPKVDDIFEARMAFIQQTIDELGSDYVEPHVHLRCKGEQHLREELARVEALGGEGLMLRQPSSKYEVGRSSTLLKVKTFHDADAKVIEHLPGTGKHKGRLGALAVELSDGTHFSVGTGFSDAERENPPPVGSIITFRYQELSDRGVPRFPSYVRHRTDVDALSQHAGTLAEKSDPISTASTSAATDTTINSSEPDMTIKSGKIKMEPIATTNATEFGASQASQTLASSSKATTTNGDWKEFQLVEGTASKFWKISQSGNDVTVRFGRIGTQGQEKTKSFATENEAKNYAQEIIAEKVKKGYSAPE